MTVAAFGIAGESDTVERPRTPSVVSNLRTLTNPNRLLHSPSCERRVRRTSHPFVLSPSPPASTGKDRSHDLVRRILFGLGRAPSRGRGQKIRSIDFCLPFHLLVCTRALGFRPCLTHALFRWLGGDRREGHFHDVLFPPWQVVRQRGRFFAASIRSSSGNDFTKNIPSPSPCALLPVRIETASTAPREKVRLVTARDVFLRWTLERRTSFYGGSPSG